MRFCIADLANVLKSQNKFAEAESSYRETIALHKKLFGEDSSLADTFDDLSGVLLAQGKLTEVEICYREALKIRGQVYGNEHLLVATSLRHLIGPLREQGKQAEADTCSQTALSIEIKHFRAEDPRILTHLENLANEYALQRKYQEGDQVFSAVLDAGGNEDQTKSAELLRARGEFRARTSRWKQAASDFAKALESNPDEHWNWYLLAPLLLQSGDPAAYRKHCQAMLARFGSTNHPPIAERTAKASLLLPMAAADIAIANRLADTAVTVGKDAEWLPFFQFAKGLAEYRQGHFDVALEWTALALTHHGSDYRDAQAYAVQAMAHKQLNHTNEAHLALAAGNEIAENKLPKLDSEDVGNAWHDVVMANILLREARLLIENKPAASETSK
jgi:serine/threonine-protein kinase